MNSYNRSAELKETNNTYKYKSEHNNPKEPIKDPSKMTYINKNFYSPKYGETTGTTMWTSPKSAYIKESKPLFKSSKYVNSKI